MANSISDYQQIATEAFVASLAENTEEYAKCCEVIQAPVGGPVKLMSLNAGGTGTDITSATSLTAADMTAGAVEVSPKAFAIKHTVASQNMSWTPTIAADAGRQLANSAAIAINKQFYDAVAATASTLHPNAGVGQGQVGGGQSFVDTNLWTLQTEAGSSSQSNKLTAALAASSLQGAREILRQYKGQRGQTLNLGNSGQLVLIVPPALEATAKELVGSVQFGNTNTVSSLFSFATVSVNPYTSDETDWFVVDKAASPVGIVMWSAPTVEATLSDDKCFVNFTARWSSNSYLKPYEAGIVGSIVA